MNMKTTYLGLNLDHPVMSGAGPMGADLDMVRRLEDAGVSAIVMPSMFEEQITREQFGTLYDLEAGSESFAEATSYFARLDDLRLGPEPYLEQIRKVKGAVGVPVIGSLNGSTPSGWLEFARQIQDAGADALELNLYSLPTDPGTAAEGVERSLLDVVRAVKAAVTLPVSVKLSPFFTSLPHFAKALEKAGADGLVLFNRFYQPDLDIEALEVEPSLSLSTPSTLRLRLRWLGTLYGQTALPMAVSGGVHSAEAAIKATMAGATGVQLVSALLQHGPEFLKTLRADLKRWLEDHEYDSLDMMRGSLSLTKCPNPQAFERANYMRVLAGWKH